LYRRLVVVVGGGGGRLSLLQRGSRSVPLCEGVSGELSRIPFSFLSQRQFGRHEREPSVPVKNDVVAEFFYGDMTKLGSDQPFKRRRCFGGNEHVCSRSTSRSCVYCSRRRGRCIHRPLLEGLSRPMVRLFPFIVYHSHTTLSKGHLTLLPTVRVPPLPTL
jgi:hypothetical protein